MTNFTTVTSSAGAPGHCITCGTPVSPDLVYCKKHWDGLHCITCGMRLAADTAWCDFHGPHSDKPARERSKLTLWVVAEEDVARSEQLQRRIDAQLGEVAETLRELTRFAIDNWLDYARKYEPAKATRVALTFQGWCAAKATLCVMRLLALADETVGDPYVPTRKEIDVALYRLAAQEAALALTEEAGIDRLARADAGPTCAKSRAAEAHPCQRKLDGEFDER